MVTQQKCQGLKYQEAIAIHKIAKPHKGTTDRITKFFEKTKILDSKPQTKKKEPISK